MNKLLLHICCAPCSVACIKQLRAEGIEPTGFWYNPNIHPYQEYKARRDTLIQYADSIDLALLIHDKYGLKKFTQAVSHNIEKRCGYCYAVRFEETARTAAELRKRSVQPQELSAMKKTMAKSGIAMNTMFDSSDRHIAEMIEKGTRMGVEDLEGQMIRLTKEGCDSEVTGLCREIVAFERSEADKIKDYD